MNDKLNSKAFDAYIARTTGQPEASYWVSFQPVLMYVTDEEREQYEGKSDEWIAQRLVDEQLVDGDLVPQFDDVVPAIEPVPSVAAESKPATSPATFTEEEEEAAREWAREPKEFQ